MIFFLNRIISFLVGLEHIDLSSLLQMLLCSFAVLGSFSKVLLINRHISACINANTKRQSLPRLTLQDQLINRAR